MVITDRTRPRRAAWRWARQLAAPLVADESGPDPVVSRAAPGQST